MENTTKPFTNSTNTYVAWSGKPQTTDVHDTIGYMCVTGSALSSCALILLINRKLQDLNGFIISFWVAVAAILSQAILMGIFEEPVIQMTESCVGLLLGHAIGARGSFVLFSFSCQLIDPALVSLLTTIQVLMLFVAQYTILKSVYPGQANQMELIGAALLLIGNAVSPFVNLYIQVKKS